VGDPLGFDARGDWKDTLVPNQYINLPDHVTVAVHCAMRDPDQLIEAESVGKLIDVLELFPFLCLLAFGSLGKRVAPRPGMIDDRLGYFQVYLLVVFHKQLGGNRSQVVGKSSQFSRQVVDRGGMDLVHIVKDPASRVQSFGELLGGWVAV